MQVRLPATDGALLLRALQRALDEAREDERAQLPASARNVPAGTSGAPVWPDRAPTVTSGTVAKPDDVPAGTSPAEPAEPAEPADTLAQRRSDALVRFAESWLVHGDRAPAGGERQQLVVHVDARTLASGAAGRSELDDGRRIDAAPPTAGSAEALVAAHRRDGPRIEPHTATGRWCGERLDLGLAVSGLLCEQARTDPDRMRPSA